MNTPNLDALPSGSVRLERIYKLHGPALVAVVKMIPIIIDHDPNAPWCHANQLRQACINLLAQLDQEG